MKEYDTILQKVGGSLTVTVPAHIVRAYDLGKGDFIRWSFTGDGTTVEFYKYAENLIPAEMAKEAAE